MTPPPNKRPDGPRPSNRQPSAKPRPANAPRRVKKDGERHSPSATPAPIPLGDAARDLVYRKLARQAQRYPALLIDELSDDAPGARALDPRDLAFAHAIYDTVIARWATLEHILQPLLNQPVHELEARMRAVILAGTAQLLLLDKVPAYAAINNAVQWAKERIRPGAGAMVNAVLRRVARLRPPALDPEAPRATYTGARNELPVSDATCIVLAEDVLPEDPIERLAAAASLPVELLHGWSTHHPSAEVRRLALHTLGDPPTILNTAHLATPLSPEQLSRMAAHEVPGHHVFTGTRAELVALLSARTDLWVQDPASSASLSLVRDLDLSGQLVIDACAGQGTKTRQLAAMFPGATIIAADTDRRRFEALSRTFADHPLVKVVPHASLRDEYAGRSRLVVLDVPCSNSGVLARRAEAKYRFSKDSLASVVSVQRQIIADAIPLLSDSPSRGMILYSTCSIEPAENQEQADWACHWHRFALTKRSQVMPAGGPGLPPTSWSDASYAALLA